MITKELFEEHVQNLNIIKKSINKRIIEIIDIVKKHVDLRPEDEINTLFNFEDLFLGENDAIYCDNIYCEKYTLIIDKFGEELALNNNIPIRWFWEDFEEELVNGILLYQEQKILKDNEKENKKSILISLKQRLELTEEESKVLDEQIKLLGKELFYFD